MTKTARGKVFYGYIITLAGSIIWLVGWGSYGAFGVFFKPIAIEFGGTRAETAGALALTAAVQAIFSIFIGWQIDKFGPRMVVPNLWFLSGNRLPSYVPGNRYLAV